MRKIRWGIIGTGRIAHTFATALKGCEDAELCAVASRNIVKANSFAEEFGFAQAYGSYSDLAGKSNADVVYIATPMSSHYQDVMLCLNNGKHVLCEKTVTLNSRQLDEILVLAKEKGLFFMEAMWMKCRPSYLKAKEWVAEGRIGKIGYVKADFSNTVPYDPNDRLFRADCGGGALLDLTVYPITLATDFLGKRPCEIVSSAHIGRDGVDLSNSVILRYDNGSFASIDSGFEIALRNNAIISGTDGFITLGDFFFCSEEASIWDRDGNVIEKFNVPDEINGYEYEIREVHRCLSEGLAQSPLVPHSGTSAVMRIMDECRRQWSMTFPGE